MPLGHSVEIFSNVVMVTLVDPAIAGLAFVA